MNVSCQAKLTHVSPVGGRPPLHLHWALPLLHVSCVCVCVCEMMMMAWLAGVLAAIAIAAFAIAMTGFGKSLLPSHPIQTVG